MHKIFPTIAAVLFLGACANVNNTGYFSRTSLQADIDSLKAKIQAFVAKVQADAPIILADAKTAINVICAMAPLVGQEAANVQSALSSPGKTVTAGLSDAQKGASITMKACAKYQQAVVSNPPTVSETVNLAVGLANGATAAADALKNAKANAGAI